MLLTGTRDCNLAAYVLLQQSRLCLSARKWDGLKKKKPPHDTRVEEGPSRPAGEQAAELAMRKRGRGDD